VDLEEEVLALDPCAYHIGALDAKLLQHIVDDLGRGSGGQDEELGLAEAADGVATWSTYT
jgi:hypothetical protein